MPKVYSPDRGSRELTAYRKGRVYGITDPLVIRNNDLARNIRLIFKRDSLSCWVSATQGESNAVVKIRNMRVVGNAQLIGDGQWQQASSPTHAGSFVRKRPYPGINKTEPD